MNTTVSIGSVYFKPFSSIFLKEFYVEDLDRDTLFYVDEFSARLDFRSLRNSRITMSKLELKEGKFSLKKYTDSTTNITFIQDYFKPAEKGGRKKGLDFILSDIAFQGMDLRYKDYAAEPVESGINYGDVHLTSLSGKLNEIDFKSHLFKADVQNLVFKEKSGLNVKKLSTIATIDSNKMEFNNLRLEMNTSQLSDYVRFEYDRFSDFSDFVNKIKIIGDFKDSKITSADIAYFAPQVLVTQFDVFITGRLSGTVNDITGKDIEIRSGKETWLTGDLSIKGLPEIEQTLFDMELKRLRSTRKDLDVLIAQLSRQNSFELPVVFDRLGKIDYQGRITGFYNNFIAHGIFHTELGDLIADVNLDIRGQGKYNGEVFSPSFDIGQLLHYPELGMASFRANVVGEGFSVENLKEELDGKFDFIEYKGYSYQNIKIDGEYKDEQFAGDIVIDDENIVLDFNGKLDLNAERFRYDFVAHVEKINLRELNIYEDSLSISGDFDANFTGNSLSTIDGKFLIQNLAIRRPQDSTYVDSLLLYTQMEDDHRVLAIESGIADAKINGEFDLKTLPSYFKSLTKTYIPSLRTEIHEFGKQEFDFELKLKDFEPLALIFAPDVTVPDEVFISGKFSSEDNTAILNGYFPEITYKKVRIRDVIFDQTTGFDALNLFITADRINFTDSLYIQNINMATILRHDSLNFNIKLSDLSATNQLDLNGLVEFEENTNARLSLLPSDVIINRQEWQVLEKVSFDFEKGKVLVNGLELSQGSQKVKLNGAISKSAEDVLNIDFERFLLSTLNPLSKPFGIDIQGEMNGDVKIKSLLFQPYILTDILAKNIIYNNTHLGDLDIHAGLDRSSELIDLDMGITNNNKETMQVSGTYDPKQEESPLDLNVQMDQGELTLFQPFLKNLVANLSGTASAELQVRGKPFEPLINGSVGLNNASFVVNYLKTLYSINETIDVKDSKIILKGVHITDKNGNQAIANGTVDMSTPLNPEIHVDIDATNFMVLNTTVKDNPLYYGNAFGTGTFTFNGPPDNMDIKIEAYTNRGTAISLPLNSPGTVSDKDFISFVPKDSAEVIKKINHFQGLTMSLDLNVTQEASAIIFTDLGRLSGNGDGLLSLKISSLGDFEMFGDYLISNGEFEFTAQDFINKKFEINRGGSIRWTGNPTEALINLTAVYEVRTSVRPLYVAAGRGTGTDQRVITQAEMTLNGNLLHPDISFGINFPTDSYIQDELQSYLSDINNVNQQALSLIVRRSFAPGTGTDLTRELNSTVLSAGTELAFNQLNNIISQSLNLNFVDFNIRSFNEASASLRLLSNRLILTGGVTDRRAELNDFNVFGKEVVSDIEALYLIRKSGNLLLRASNRLSNRNFLNPTDEYISAVGLVYRQEFDTFSEFLRRLLFFGKNRQEVSQNPIKKDPVLDTSKKTEK